MTDDEQSATSAGADAVHIFASAARTTSELINRIDPAGWDGPGLGEWDLRALVGHASRSLTTVLDYLQRPADRCDIATPAGYLAAIGSATFAAGAVLERGRRAGRDLGPAPAAAFATLVERATAAVRTAPLDMRIETILGGMRVSTYLPTRTFELVVHGLDISGATGLPVEYPPAPLEAALTVAEQAALLSGRGPDLLRALTGRTSGLGFSVV